jgi:class 3 adenylate cyclase
MNAEIDVRNVLPSIRVPSLVIHRSEDQCLKVEEGRFVAERIPGAKFVELPGDDHLPFVGDQDAILDEVEEFLTGVRHRIEPDTVLATVMVARMTGVKESTGDWWRRLHAHITKEIEWFRGREIDMVEDRLLAIFDGPARAIRCATAITEYTSRLGVETRTGLHTGECETVDSKVSGVAVSMSVCVSFEAAAGEVLVSSTVKDLVAGSGIQFDDRGVHNLPSCGEWRLFAVQKGS